MRKLRRAALAIGVLATALVARSQTPTPTPSPPVSSSQSASPPAAPSPSGGASTASTPATGCALSAPSLDAARAAACEACHDAADHGAHPVGVDYAASLARRPDRFRPVSDVLARGVFLRDGAVACVTCHDPTSPWRSHLAIPRGAPARPAVVPGRPETFEATESWRTSSAARPPRGTAVTPTPLCIACHTMD